MMLEQQTAATAEAIEGLEEKRAVKALAKWKVAQSSFQDVQHTLETIQEDLMALNSCTGIESLLISIRFSAENYTQPIFFCSSKAIMKYFTMVWRTTLLEIACKMEAYLLSGVGGVVASHVDSIVNIKKSIVQLISDTLYEAIVNPNIPPPCMNYTNFSDVIISKFSVVITDWPLPNKFCSLGNTTSKNKLAVLHHTWVMKQVRFKKMNGDEFSAWRCVKHKLEHTELNPKHTQLIEHGLECVKGKYNHAEHKSECVKHESECIGYKPGFGHIASASKHTTNHVPHGGLQQRHNSIWGAATHHQEGKEDTLRQEHKAWPLQLSSARVLSVVLSIPT
ncbi:hypothetical protein EYR38_002228 [Pleurotus pulmonarius]|nr:hypothetical protein EYR38_002228 [Pleurotus pulmonarius]